MARRRRQRLARKKRTEGEATSARAVEEKIEGFAEDLGRLLGTAQAKASSWLGAAKEHCRPAHAD